LQIINVFGNSNDTKTPVCFTLDAGANVHVLYPENVSEKKFATYDELVGFGQNVSSTFVTKLVMDRFKV
jgi:diphosphomevalonate decarboxylase